jgi:hypothetical protein
VVELEFTSELTDYNPHVFQISRSVAMPYRSSEGAICYRLAGMRNEALQNEKLFGRKMGYAVARAVDLMSPQVNRAIGQ